MNNKQEKKTMHVVRIIDNKNIIINAGRNHGLEVGDQLIVLDKDSRRVIDPITNEDLGPLHVPKEKIQVKTVEDKYSICSNAKNTSELYGIPNRKNFFMPESTLNVNTSAIDENFYKSISPINVGDPVQLS